jgi:deoxycytidylate deaminase
MDLPSLFRQAIVASRFSDHVVKMGACVVVKGRVISTGFNQRFKTHPLIKKFHEHQTIHAEVSAILRTKNKDLLKDSIMVVYRERRDTKNPVLAKPCPTCQEIMKFFGVWKVIYTTDGGFDEMLLTP